MCDPDDQNHSHPDNTPKDSPSTWWDACNPFGRSGITCSSAAFSFFLHSKWNKAFSLHLHIENPYCLAEPCGQPFSYIKVGPLTFFAKFAKYVAGNKEKLSNQGTQNTGKKYSILSPLSEKQINIGITFTYFSASVSIPFLTLAWAVGIEF